MDAYSRAIKELEEIDGQIAVLQQRRVALRQFVELGQTLYQPTQFEAPLTKLKRILERELTMKEQILTFVEGHLLAHGPTHSRTLLAALETAGIAVSGADKLNTLSVMLSKSNRFQANRVIGWTLAKTPEQEEARTDAGTSAGLGTGSSTVPGQGPGSAA